jgi:hypothetical protein
MRVRRLLAALAALAMVLVPVGVVAATSGSVAVADNGVINSKN